MLNVQSPKPYPPQISLALLPQDYSKVFMTIMFNLSAVVVVAVASMNDDLEVNGMFIGFMTLNLSHEIT